MGVYLHWHGSPSSVVAYLAAAKTLGFRSPTGDSTYAMARFVQMIGNHIGGTLSIGVGCIEHLDTDNYDNGTYVVGDEWKIVNMYGKGSEKPATCEISSDHLVSDDLLREILKANNMIVCEEHSRDGMRR